MHDPVKDLRAMAAKAASPYLIPLRIAAVVAVAVVLVILAGKLGFRFDPFNWTGKKIAKQEQTIELQADDLKARGLELEGQKAQAQRLDIFLKDARTGEAALSESTAKAWSAPDADQPLDPDRALRLRDNDDSLCRIRPTLCPGGPDGRPAPAGDAGGR